MITREEAIKIINCYDIGFCDLSGKKIPADKLVDAFDMAIEALEQTRWIPVSEALPSEGQVVLAIGDKGTWDVGKFQGTAGWTDDKRMWRWKNKAVKRVEYWMPKGAIPLPCREDG